MQSTELETQLLLNSLNTALVMVDEQLNIAFANHAGEALFETGKKQLIGHPLSDFFMPGSIETTRLRAAMRRGEDFTENEINFLEKIGFLPVSLGPRVLRAETAVISSLSAIRTMCREF